MARLPLLALLLALALAGAASAQQPMQQPAVNTPLLGCVEGRALRIVNGYPACSTTVPPTVSACGIGATVSAQATDFVGQVTTGASLVTTCTITLSKLYASLGCLAQSNTSSTSVSGAPVVGSAGGKTTVTITLTLGLASGKITYTCFPV